MKILSKEVLSDFQGVRVISMEILAPRIALKAKPGQFIALMVNKDGERVPLTIVSAKKDTIRIIFQEAGFTTKFLGRFNPQDSLYAIVGPLGHATDVKHFGKVILVGGGVGIAEIYPVAKALKEAGNNVTVILGARTKGLLILENELRDASSQIFVATDDGSYQRKGFVTDIL